MNKTIELIEKEYMKENVPDFAVGDTVNIDAGPLAGFDGVITELNDMAQKAKVNIQMFGRSTDVEVEYIQIKKIDAPIAEEKKD